VSVFAAATGIGSWPGSSPREAAEVVIGELHTLPHLVELPARGVGADMIGRAGALLVDIGIDTVPRGYRIAAGRSAVVRRAASLLDEDIDALEEAWEKAGLRGGTRTVKVQAPGPITLAATSSSWPAATARSPTPVRCATWPGRWPRGWPPTARSWRGGWTLPWWWQFDEPSLPAALEGRLTGVTSFTPVAHLSTSRRRSVCWTTALPVSAARWHCTAAQPVCRGRPCSAAAFMWCRLTCPR